MKNDSWGFVPHQQQEEKGCRLLKVSNSQVSAHGFAKCNGMYLSDFSDLLLLFSDFFQQMHIS